MTKVLVFDSGLGGLTVHREISRLLPATDLVYVADDRGFPYGDWEAAPLRDHIVSAVSNAIETHDPGCVVIACNTAATLVLPALRSRFALPFVGTVPAIKPAASATRSGLISVLATPGTVQRDYTKALIDTFATHISVTLVGAPNLAALAEAALNGDPIDEHAVNAEISPCFVETENGRTDHIVLACTHFPLLLPIMNRLAPWPVSWIDPAPAIARRVQDVVSDTTFASSGSRTFLYTSGKSWDISAERVSV